MSRYDGPMSRDDEAAYAYDEASSRYDGSIDGGYQRHDAISEPPILSDAPRPGDDTSSDW